MMMKKLLLVSLLMMYSVFGMSGIIYETEKTKERISVNGTYSAYDLQKKLEEESEVYLNKIDPLFSYVFFDDMSSICPGWLKSEKKYETKIVEICWRPSKPLMEIKLNWQQYRNSSIFILMPEKLSNMNFGQLDFYKQPIQTQACTNAESLTMNQLKNQVNFTNYDEALCAQQKLDNVYRDLALCRLPMEKKFDQYKYQYGQYYGTKIGFNSIQHLSKTDGGRFNLYQKFFAKFSAKYSISTDDEIYLGYGVLNQTTVFNKDKRGNVYISTEGSNKPISVICVLNQDKEVKTIEFFE